MKRITGIVLLMLSFASLAYADSTPTEAQVSGKCMTCHKEKSAGLYQQ